MTLDARAPVHLFSLSLALSLCVYVFVCVSVTRPVIYICYNRDLYVRSFARFSALFKSNIARRHFHRKKEKRKDRINGERKKERKEENGVLKKEEGREKRQLHYDRRKLVVNVALICTVNERGLSQF